MTTKERIKKMGWALLALSAAGFLIPTALPHYFDPSQTEALSMMSLLFSTLSLFCFFSKPERRKL
jgi:hypothetical protein